MRKLSILGLALLATMGLAAAAYAADTATVNIHVTVTTGYNSIIRTSAENFTIGTGAMITAATNVTVADNDHRMIFQNNGDTRQNWAVTAGDFPGWTYVAGVPGTAMTVADQVRLAGIFADYGGTYVVADFADNDTLTNTIRWASDTSLARDAQIGGQKGIGLQAGDERGFYVSFDAPTAASTNLGRDLTAVITVTAGAY